MPETWYGTERYVDTLCFSLYTRTLYGFSGVSELPASLLSLEALPWPGLLEHKYCDTSGADLITKVATKWLSGRECTQALRFIALCRRHIFYKSKARPSGSTMITSHCIAIFTVLCWSELKPRYPQGAHVRHGWDGWRNDSHLGRDGAGQSKISSLCSEWRAVENWWTVCFWNLPFDIFGAWWTGWLKPQKAKPWTVISL